MEAMGLKDKRVKQVIQVILDQQEILVQLEQQETRDRRVLQAQLVVLDLLVRLVQVVRMVMMEVKVRRVRRVSQVILDLQVLQEALELVLLWKGKSPLQVIYLLLAIQKETPI